MSEKHTSEDARQLCGAWRYIGATLDGKPRAGRGANPKGMIYYGPCGEMIVQVAPDKERGMAGAKPTPEEALAALDEYIAYFGTYSLDEHAKTVTHHRAGSVQPNDTKDLVRGYRFVGNRLILQPPDTTYEVMWERVT